MINDLYVVLWDEDIVPEQIIWTRDVCYTRVRQFDFMAFHVRFISPKTTIYQCVLFCDVWGRVEMIIPYISKQTVIQGEIIPMQFYYFRDTRKRILRAFSQD